MATQVPESAPELYPKVATDPEPRSALGRWLLHGGSPEEASHRRSRVPDPPRRPRKCVTPARVPNRFLRPPGRTRRKPGRHLLAGAALCALWLALWGALRPAAAQEARRGPPPAPLRVMTFNILHARATSPAGPWVRRRPLAVEVIRRWQPDLLGMQEVMDPQLPELTASLPEYGVVPGPISGASRLFAWAATGSPLLAALWMALLRVRQGRPRRRGWRILAWLLGLAALTPLLGAVSSRLAAGSGPDPGEQLPIFYRRDRFRVVTEGAFWLSANPDHPDSVFFASWLPRLVNWARFAGKDGRIATLYNTHLEYLNPRVRVLSTALIVEHMNAAWDDTPQLLTGDFNETVSGPAVRQLRTRSAAPPAVPALADAWSSAARREGPDYSFHAGRGRYRWPGGRIDHILLRPPAPVPRITVINTRQGNLFPSDHYPICAEIAFPATPAPHSP